MAGRGRRCDINYIKPKVPKFIQNFKNELNYVEEPNVNSKREKPTFDDSQDDIEREDEQPVVVFDPKEVSVDEAVQYKEEISRKRQHNGLIITIIN